MGAASLPLPGISTVGASGFAPSASGFAPPGIAIPQFGGITGLMPGVVIPQLSTQMPAIVTPQLSSGKVLLCWLFINLFDHGFTAFYRFLLNT